MAENKKSFVAYADWLESFEMLEDVEAGKLIKHLLRYVNDKNPELDDRLLKIAFAPIKAQLKRDLNKYETIIEKRKEAGRKGGIISSKKAKQANAKSVNQTEANGSKRKQIQHDTVNVNDNDTVNVNDILSSESKKNARAIDFLKNNFPSRFETDFLMKYKSKIENPKKFAEDFNDTVDQEKLEFDDKVLFGRLGKYARNWIENQSKSQKYSSNDTGNSSDKIPVG